MCVIELNIGGFNKDEFMAWCVTTQTHAPKLTVKLYEAKNSSIIYFNKTGTRNPVMLPPLEQNAAKIVEGNLKLSLDIPTTNEIKPWMNSYNILSAKGIIVGSGCDICFEDSIDDDYNDVFVSLIAWKNKG